MILFTDKNQARKTARETARVDYKMGTIHEARRRRRIYRGAFGLSANAIFNELAVGTTATFRKGKEEA